MNLSLPHGLLPLLVALPLLAPVPTSAGPARPGQLALVSANEAGEAVGGLPQGGAMCALSADGRRVAFTTETADLDATDTNDKLDAYVKDLDTGRVQRVSVGAASPGVNSPGTRCHDMTPDGRYVVVSSFNAVFVRDLLTGRLKQLSPPAETLPNVAGFLGGSISDDGTRLLSQSSHDPLVSGDTNGQWDLVVRDLLTGDMSIESRNSQGAQTYPSFPGGAYYGQARWAAGNHTVFNSQTPSTLGDAGFYRKHLSSGELDAVLPFYSGDGRAIGFQSIASNLVPGGTPFGELQLYVKRVAAAP